MYHFAKNKTLLSLTISLCHQKGLKAGGSSMACKTDVDRSGAPGRRFKHTERQSVVGLCLTATAHKLDPFPIGSGAREGRGCNLNSCERSRLSVISEVIPVAHPPLQQRVDAHPVNVHPMAPRCSASCGSAPPAPLFHRSAPRWKRAKNPSWNRVSTPPHCD